MQVLAGEVCRFQLWCGLGVSSVTLFPAARYTMEYAAKPEEGDAWVIEQCCVSHRKLHQPLELRPAKAYFRMPEAE